MKRRHAHRRRLQARWHARDTQGERITSSIDQRDNDRSQTTTAPLYDLPDQHRMGQVKHSIAGLPPRRAASAARHDQHTSPRPNGDRKRARRVLKKPQQTVTALCRLTLVVTVLPSRLTSTVVPTPERKRQQTKNHPTSRYRELRTSHVNGKSDIHDGSGSDNLRPPNPAHDGGNEPSEAEHPTHEPVEGSATCVTADDGAEYVTKAVR